MKFEGTQSYVATDDLKLAVNAAITLQRPLLVKGEPGTGKTMLAEQLAESFGAKLITWHIKSTTKAHQGLYEYDAVSRLRDSQLGVDKVHDVRNYIKKGKLWEAFEAEERVILLIDEIDKADIEFPNDLLQELDKMEFYVYETNETIKAKQRPIIIITSNNEKELPDAFLRRCFFHYIAFPDRETLQKIVDVHYPNIKQSLVSEALDIFFDVRKVPGLKKETFDFRAGRLAETADGRRDRRSGAARTRSDQGDPHAGRRPGEERAGRAASRAPGVHEPPRQPLSAAALSGERAAGRHARQRRNIPCSAEVACAARYVTRSTRPSNRPAIVIAASAARPTARRSPPTARCAARRSAMSPGGRGGRIPLVARRHPYLLPPLRIEPAVAWRQRGPEVHLDRPRHPSTRRCHR